MQNRDEQKSNGNSIFPMTSKRVATRWGWFAPTSLTLVIHSCLLPSIGSNSPLKTREVQSWHDWSTNPPTTTDLGFINPCFPLMWGWLEDPFPISTNVRCCLRSWPPSDGESPPTSLRGDGAQPGFRGSRWGPRFSSTKRSLQKNAGEDTLVCLS